MCQMSMKLPAITDQNSPHTFDKIVKTLNNKKRPQSLTLTPNVKVIAEIIVWGTKNMPPKKKN